MTKAEMLQQVRALAHWEGRVPWPYLDNAETPNVTVGVGCLVGTVDDMRVLGLRRYSDDKPATDAEASAEFCRLRSMRGGQRAAAYRDGLYLPEQDIDALALGRLSLVVDHLPAVFPAWSVLPSPAQACIIDLAWNVGWFGLTNWRKLRAALECDPPDWDKAAEECTTANPRELAGRAARNAWRVSCMQAASEGKLTPSPL